MTSLFTFKILLKTNIPLASKIFKVMVVLSLQAIASKPTLAPRVFIINSLAPIPPLKMVVLKENTDM